jgi:hypothetical protein
VHPIGGVLGIVTKDFDRHVGIVSPVNDNQVLLRKWLRQALLDKDLV